jgi:amidase
LIKSRVYPTFLALSLLLNTPATAQVLDLPNATIEELRSALALGKINSRLLIQQYQERITQYNDAGPKINAIAVLNPDALSIAEQRDAERQAGNLLGSLHGIPILIKDNIDTGDKMQTTAGSLALVGNYASEDAFVVKQLRAAGAIILGKTNLSEFANYISTRLPNGYSSRGGQVLNPYGLNFDPSGSSSGSGAAATASFAAATVGSETSGSILSPSNDQSLVGIKPTLGLVSSTGIIPIAHSQDTAGPMARTVSDAAILLGAMTGVDPADPATAASEGKALKDYTPFLKIDGLKGMRLGIPRREFFDSKKEKADYLVVEKAIRILKAQGAVIVDPAEISDADRVNRLGYAVLDYEFKTDLNAYLAAHPKAPVHSLAEVIAFNKAHAKTALRYGQDILIAAQRIVHDAKAENRYRRQRALDLRLSRTEGIDAVMNRYQLDAVIFPMSNGSDIGARAGYPTIIVPAGYREDGHPVGISFLGRAWSEGKLIQIAYAFEQASKFRRPPALSAAKYGCRYGQPKPCK